MSNILRSEHLLHFSPWEFRRWWDYMSPRQLILLDLFRSRWGDQFSISPHPAALGRELGPSEETQHNIDCWGECRATDGFPAGLLTRSDARRAVTVAKSVGFTGIGIYPHWQFGKTQCVGIHLDSRLDRAPGNPAMWGGVSREGKQVYVGIQEAISKIPA